MTDTRMHRHTHTHGANYNLPPAHRAGDKNRLKQAISLSVNMGFRFSFLS